MNKPSCPAPRTLPVLALALALAGCGGEPAPATQSTSRSAAQVSMVAAPDQYADAIHHLYVAYFGRAAEPAGMTWWNRQLTQLNAPLEPARLAGAYRSNAQVRATLEAFANSLESKELYPGSSAQFVDGVYRNLFNRSAEDGGLAWWRTALDSGAITRAEAAMLIMSSARNDDAASVRNKIAVAHRFFALLSESPEAVAAYTGNRNTEIVRRMMAKVDARTDLASFEPVIRAAIAEMVTMS